MIVWHLSKTWQTLEKEETLEIHADSCISKEVLVVDLTLGSGAPFNAVIPRYKLHDLFCRICQSASLQIDHEMTALKG